jgi:CelD/BcsL family acetyltransferase involved in cellulose biosynthesis
MIEVVNSLSRLRQLGDEWCVFAQQTVTPLLQHDWFMTSAEAFCPPEKLHILINRNDGKINAIAPLVLVRGTVVDRLEILGAQILCEPTGFIFSEDDGLRELIQYIVHMRKPTFFRRFDLESPESAMLVNQSKGRFIFRKPSAAPWIPITQTWNEYEKKMSSRDRYTIRRARKRAEERGSVQLEVFSPDIHDVPKYMEEVFRVEALSWKELDGTSMGMDTSLGRFFYNYSLTAATKGMLRLALLRINSQVVAFQIAVVYANRFWVLKIGFDESFSHCSPGTLLMHETIHYAFEQKLETFELLGTDEPWLHMWTDEIHRYMSIHLYPASVGGLINLGGDASGYLRRRIPPAKNLFTIPSVKSPKPPKKNNLIKSLNIS